LGRTLLRRSEALHPIHRHLKSEHYEITTLWGDQITQNHAELVGLSDSDQSVRSLLESSGMAADSVLQSIDQLVNGQAVMLATNQIMTAIGIVFFVAASVIWLAPKPTRVVDAAAGGH